MADGGASGDGGCDAINPSIGDAHVGPQGGGGVMDWALCMPEACLHEEKCPSYRVAID